MTSMAKKAVSVTIDTNNLTWLKGRVAATSLRSISELIDRLITEARSSGSAGAIRSVVGTIDIDPSDPLLDQADETLRAQFARSLRRPIAVEGNTRLKARRSARSRG
jgi:hypothetical protein